MDLRKLSYFVEVVNEQSFSHAAQKLYLSQPMLSKAIRQLETELGVQLIKRSSKSFQVTDAGKLIYHQSMKILNDCRELEHLLDDSKGLIAGSVSISIPAIVIDLYFIPLFIHLQNEFPELNVDLFEEGSRTILESVVNDRVDMGVVMMPVPTQDIDVYPIVTDECALIVNQEHPLANEKLVDISRLEHEKFVLFNRNFVLYDMIRQACFSRQFSPNIVFQSSRTSFIYNMVAQNRGITILPAPTFPQNADALRKIKLMPEIPWSLALIIKKNRYFSPAALKVIENILSYFEGNTYKITKSNAYDI